MTSSISIPLSVLIAQPDLGLIANHLASRGYGDGCSRSRNRLLLTPEATQGDPALSQPGRAGDQDRAFLFRVHSYHCLDSSVTGIPPPKPTNLHIPTRHTYRLRTPMSSLSICQKTGFFSEKLTGRVDFDKIVKQI